MRTILLKCFALAVFTVQGYSQDSQQTGEVTGISGFSNKFQNHKIQVLTSNSEYSDFSPLMYCGNLVFASCRKDLNHSQRKSDDGTEYRADLYTLKNKNSEPVVEVFFKDKYNEFSAVFAADGKTMYYTGNDLSSGKMVKGKRGARLLKIYRTSLVDGKWKRIKDLSFNNEKYNVAYPALSLDGKTLYFSSDMPGSTGQSDLYRVSIDEKGKFGKPENLGSKINTGMSEVFPYVSSENILYYASNRPGGFGGMDIYMSAINPDGTLGDPVNVGVGMNSVKDDYSLIYDEVTRTGYFASNRDGGKGDDDIYTFRDVRPATKKPEPVIETPKEEVVAEVSEEEIAKEVPEEKIVMAVPEEKPVRIPIEHLREDLSTIRVYFATKKAFIEKEFIPELESVRDMMLKYPSLRIQVASYSDSRGSEEYNLELTARRSKSAIVWLVNNGVDRTRFTIKAYGEKGLINKCADGVKCTEEEHGENRRTKFIITSY